MVFLSVPVQNMSILLLFGCQDSETLKPEAKQLQQKKYTDDNEGEKHQQRNESAVTHEIIEKFLNSKACAAHTKPDVDAIAIEL